jgi:hypothetical protein
MMSVPPPAGKPTITWTGFFTACAFARAVRPAVAERSPAAPAAST